MYFARLSTGWGEPREASIAIGRFIIVATVTQLLIEKG